MSVKITYFVHSTTTDNQKGVAAGWNDVALSEVGVQQSRELGAKINDQHFEVIFTSDLSRAINTAQLAWGDKYPIVHDTRLRECNYGELNGQPTRQIELLQEQSIFTPMPGGESYTDVQMRVKDFLSFLKEKYNDKHVAIVAHRAPQLAMDVLIKEISWQEAFEQDWRKTKSWQPGWEYIVR